MLWQIKKRLYELQLHQYELARMVGTDESYLCRIIRGRQEPSSKLRQKISEVLGAPESLLFQKAA
jgi:transcriptional regulator with XRE-family HTH domain